MALSSHRRGGAATTNTTASDECDGCSLIDGSTKGPWIFDGWADDLPEFSLEPIDLQEELDVATASMADAPDNAGLALLGRPRRRKDLHLLSLGTKERKRVITKLESTTRAASTS